MRAVPEGRLLILRRYVDHVRDGGVRQSKTGAELWKWQVVAQCESKKPGSSPGFFIAAIISANVERES
jgi:hypothetical protein